MHNRTLNAYIHQYFAQPTLPSSLSYYSSSHFIEYKHMLNSFSVLPRLTTIPLFLYLTMLHVPSFYYWFIALQSHSYTDINKHRICIVYWDVETTFSQLVIITIIMYDHHTIWSLNCLGNDLPEYIICHLSKCIL